ncbi:hypothetical protein [Paraburkholderia sp.]|uniref:hypothetical protein n=1 Tax=Paraburkholderia sp. TaxID=1926495 RepID=UPI0039E2E31B
MDIRNFTTGEQFSLDHTAVDSSSAMGIGPVAGDEQKKLRALIERRHPEYEEHVNHWAFIEQTYAGGREWFDENVFRYIKEGDKEFNDRLARAYRFNHTKEVVDLLNKYLFKQAITRNETDAPDFVKQFWKRCTRNGLGIQDFARQIASRTSRQGRIGIVIDNTKTDAVTTRAEEKAAGVQTYAYLVGPQQLLDYSYDDMGALQWVLIQETARDDADPMTSSGEVLMRFRLWTKIDWRLFELQGKGKKQKVVEIARGNHNLNVVPVILADHVITDELYCAPSMIDDIAYLDRAVANYLSNLDAIIQDQTFSQLAMPAQNMLPGDDNYTKMMEMGTKRIFLYDGEGGAEPKYISPDPKQAQMILAVIHKIINEIYHTVGLAGERTKQDNSLGIDNSSGVAKAYDFERVNALLAAKADSLQSIENKIVALVALWNGEDLSADEEFVTYPDDFDTRGLYDEFDIAARLSLIEAPDLLRQEQMKAVIDKLFPQLAQDIKAKIVASLKDWPPAGPLELQAQQMSQQQLQKTSDRSLASESMTTKSEG